MGLGYSKEEKSAIERAVFKKRECDYTTPQIKRRIEWSLGHYIAGMPCKIHQCRDRLRVFLGFFWKKRDNETPVIDCVNKSEFIKNQEIQKPHKKNSRIVVFKAEFNFEGSTLPIFGKIHEQIKKNDKFWSEIQLYKFINTLILRGATPHVVAYLTDFPCKSSELGNLRGSLSGSGPDSVFNVVLTESTFLKTVTLDKIYHKKRPSDEEMRNILFQVLWTLAVFHKVGFEQHDMHFDNILVTKHPEPVSFRYKLDDGNYFRVVTSHSVRIFDFDQSNKWGTDLDGLEVRNPLMCYDPPAPYYFTIGKKPRPFWDLIKFVVMLHKHYPDFLKYLPPFEETWNLRILKTHFDAHDNGLDDNYEKVLPSNALNLHEDLIKYVGEHSRQGPTVSPNMWEMPSKNMFDLPKLWEVHVEKRKREKEERGKSVKKQRKEMEEFSQLLMSAFE